jgi:hypothetical protein
MFKQYNIDPWQHIGSLLQAQHQLAFGTPEVKVTMLRQLAADMGFDLANLPAAGAAQENPLTGVVRGLQQKIAQLEGNVTGVTNSVQSAQSAELERNIVAFMQDPAHPYFTQVADQIAPLISSGAARTLLDAYELAVLQNPVTRAAKLEADMAALTATRTAADAKKAADARKATGANVRSRNGVRNAPAAESIDDTLKNTMAAINARH